MATTVNHNVTDSTSTGVSITTLYFPTSDYALDESNAGETVLVNLTSPLGMTEHVARRTRTVSNIYSGSQIDTTLWSPTRRGTEVNVKLMQTWSVEDSANPSATYAYPVTANLTLRLPNDRAISTTDVEYLIKALLGKLYPDGTSDLAAFIRGATNPL